MCFLNLSRASRLHFSPMCADVMSVELHFSLHLQMKAASFLLRESRMTGRWKTAFACEIAPSEAQSVQRSWNTSLLMFWLTRAFPTPRNF
jgi:hypothetical protein